MFYIRLLLGTGPVTCRNESELSKFVSDIEGLTATGGGDCPELRFMGMLKAFAEGYRYGSPMFVFTDASAKDGNSSNMAELKGAAARKDATMTFFTDLNGCSSDGIKGHEKIVFDANGKYKPEFIIILQIYGKKNEKASSFGRDH